MSLANYQRLLPGGLSLERLQAIVKNYAGLEMDWDIHLMFQTKRNTRDASRFEFGWTTWLVSERPNRDADDLILSPQAA